MSMGTGGSSRVLLYDPSFVDPAQDSGMGLWWCETPEDVAARRINAVCLSTLGSWQEVPAAADFIQQWQFVFAASPRREFVETVRRYVRCVPIYSPAENAFHGYDSLSAFAAEHTATEVDRLLYGAIQEIEYGILEVARIDVASANNIPRYLSGLPALDKHTRGFRQGELSVWTGKRGEGKSSLLGQILLDAIDQGGKVMAYSGELPARQFKAWVLLQAAGPRGVDFCQDEFTGQPIFFTKPTVAKLIDEWWAKKFFLSDINAEFAHNENRILDDFAYAHRNLGCDVFLVDNIMTTQLNDDRDFYRAQSKFAQRLSRFAKANSVHVHLVAHPRKVQGERPIVDADDISGSGDIPNIADNAFSVRRLDEETAAVAGCSSAVSILKCRETGRKGINVKLDFDERVKRFWCHASPGRDKSYMWERMDQLELQKIDSSTPSPFD